MSRMQDQIVKHPKTVAGIDVGKSQLDVFIHPAGTRLRVPNTTEGAQSALETLKKYGVELTAMEATGKYHCLAHSLFHEAGLAVAVINPFRSRQFADSIGRLAKTDTIDAEALALYAERLDPAPTSPPEARFKELRELHAARRQVVAEVSDLKRQLQTTEHPLAADQIRARIAIGEMHRADLDKAILTLIRSDETLKRRFQILLSVPGIGKTTAAIMLADLGELGEANAKQIAALAGVAPMNWDSGIKNGKRMIRGGRQQVRNALYMCAVTCIRRSDSFGLTYRNLVARGKNPKIALTAVMRKLVILANTLVAENRVWEPVRPS